MRSPDYEYWTLQVLKGSWLHIQVMSEAETKNAKHRVPHMLRARLEASYEQEQDRLDPETLAEIVANVVQGKLDKLVLNALPIVRDEHVEQPGASRDDLDKMLDFFNADG